MLIDKKKICELIPHGRGMSLIDRVIEYDNSSIRCETESYKNPKNPLLENGQLSTILLVEYASQVAAIHAALNQQTITQGKPAYIGSVKSVRLHQNFISNSEESLAITCRCLLSNTNGAIYEFDVQGHQLIAEGQINLILPK